MASKTTGWKCTHTARIIENTDTYVKILVTCYWQNDGWNYDINHVSAWVYCGDFSQQVKNNGSINSTASNSAKVTCGSYTFTINKTTAAQSIYCYSEITSNSSYVSGTKASTATAVFVDAKTSYTISYDANGGSGAPSEQTKWYGIDLTLSNTNPTRANYKFLGWSESASATTATYAAGGSYTNNAAVTLYAVWELTYIKPKIYNFSVSRCDYNGTPNEKGKYFSIYCNWETTYSNPINKVMVIQADGTSRGAQGTLEGKSGTINSQFVFMELSPDVSYTVSLEISDNGGNYEVSATLNGLAFPFDAVMTEEGVGAAVGKPAEVAGLFDVALDTKFNNPVYGNVLGLNKLPAIPERAELNDYINTGAWAIYSDAVAATITCGGVLLGTNDSVPPARAGRFEVNSSTGEGIRAEEWSYLRQRFIPYNDANPIYERDIARGEDNVWNYYDWWRSNLSPAASKKIYYSKSAVTYGRLENYTMSVANTCTLLPFNFQKVKTDDRLKASGYGSILVNDDISYVKVSANILVKCGAAGTRHFRIQKKSGSTISSEAWTCINAAAGSNTLFAFTPIIIPVKKNDIIQVVYYTADTTAYLVSGSSVNGLQSYLTVEEL